jgi:hypothetical protein
LKYGFPVKHCQQQQFFKSEIIPKEKGNLFEIQKKRRKKFEIQKKKVKEIRNTKELRNNCETSLKPQILPTPAV